MFDVSIIIVSYNVADILRDCLRSLYKTVGTTYEVYVVDNASPDGSADIVGNEFPEVHLVRSPINGGYAYANNLALDKIGISGKEAATKYQQSRYVLLLNPDTVLTEDAISNMVAFMDASPDVGIAGPKLLRADGSLDLACRRSFPTPKVALYRMMGLSTLFPRSPRFARYNLTYLDPDDITEVDSVVGAFMMLRWEALDAAGPLDESFFLYGEDLDLSLRIKSLGWKVIYYPAVTVLHYKGESSKTHRPKAVFEFYRSMLIFYRKHYSHTTPRPLGWLIVSAIYARGLTAFLWNVAGYRLLPARISRR